MTRTASITSSLILLLDLGACVFSDKQIGDGADEASSTMGSDEGPGDSTDTGASTDTGDSAEMADTAEDTGPFDECEGPFPNPSYDRDCDEVGLECDNDRDHRNPDQLNQDADMFGDSSDFCPLLTGRNNTADSDKDHIGNACDLCPKHHDDYNAWALGIDAKMYVRNIPSYVDTDEDGVGDVCDNCPMVPNCQDYGPDNPAPFGAEAGNAADCQLDDDNDGIGNACEGEPMPPPESAGPIGFAATDDFDQDGLVNAEDGCPRLPRGGGQPCTSDVDCEELGDGFECASAPTLGGIRICNHRDTDGDGVGDECDTCPTTANPIQVTEGGMQLDDEDRDFIGADCEAHVDCSMHSEARPYGYFDTVVHGYCCVTTWPGDDALHDPDGKPIRLECTSEQEEAGICRKLPASVAAMPGVIELPPGCEDALAEAGLDEAAPLTLADFGGDAALLSNYACMLPPWDQDFDGLGDSCDLCKYAFDPANQPYVDDMGNLSLDEGRFCNGDYAKDLVPGAACEWP